MYEYNHTRPTRSWGGNISTANVNASGNTLADEIETALTGKHFCLRMDGTDLDCCFQEELTGPEQTTLGNTVDAFTAVQPE